MNSQTFHILVVGSRQVGKTKLLDGLMEKPFTETYVQTQNNTQLTYSFQLQSTLLNLYITEMSKIPFSLFKQSAIPQFDYIIFVYDLTRPSTWHDLKKYKEQIDKYLENNSKARYFIIGNKVDKSNLMDIKKMTFFAPHIEITANTPNQKPKEICLEIWQNAMFYKDCVNKSYGQSLLQDLNFIEAQFQVSTPTCITKIKGNCSIKAIKKAILLGSQNVGKSDMIALINGQPLSPQYIKTIGVDFKIMTVRCKGKNYRLQFWDTSGDPKLRKIVQCYLRDINICLYVYDVTNLSSFEQIKKFYAQMKNKNNKNDDQFLSILIGNKIDLENQRKVSFQEGQKLAEQLKMKFYEVSVKNNHGVLEAFLSTLQEFLNRGQSDY